MKHINNHNSSPHLSPFIIQIFGKSKTTAKHSIASTYLYRATITSPTRTCVGLPSQQDLILRMAKIIGRCKSFHTTMLLAFYVSPHVLYLMSITKWIFSEDKAIHNVGFAQVLINNYFKQYNGSLLPSITICSKTQTDCNGWK